MPAEGSLRDRLADGVLFSVVPCCSCLLLCYLLRHMCIKQCWDKAACSSRDRFLRKVKMACRHDIVASQKWAKSRRCLAVQALSSSRRKAVESSRIECSVFSIDFCCPCGSTAGRGAARSARAACASWASPLPPWRWWCCQALRGLGLWQPGIGMSRPPVARGLLLQNRPVDAARLSFLRRVFS